MGDDDLYQDELELLPDESDVQELEHEYDEEQDAAEHVSELPESDTTAPDPLEQMPLELTLRCGNLTLTLGELRRLASGTVLEVSGITPGHATLCHGERVVAEGELVDVDGRLGLQITRMAS
ncbi:FliM/FliN family flagellar motor switch protein [Pseudomonas sp. RTC3]|uniref:FliM/FliN family flagellar motor switch protein n=1 Tax=unclassified Pseudomonas TaxID=196821 RepID=UPI002AB59FBD|nr:FliM/FliN family flagellar motor switch protein [Pseudomonas sp. 5C2]MDY7564691.1 FliM/FliN family flagellar motor switch protein [Pseudomonas sp. 5C2]MEB0060662.1 FliM/FliN family flagellar motor switch protein [Pseudomonas sp. RTC3]MEB0240879.1 FliM/FliN family flagellar motor switch protein [Pseudomonas sp. 5C2]